MSYQSTASLAPTGGNMPAGNGLQAMFWDRLWVGLYGNDAAYDAWVTAVQAGNENDEKWFADRYSAYVLFFTY